MNQILNKQNDSENIKLLKASSVAYTKAKIWETRISYFLVILAVAYPISYLLIKHEPVKLLLFGCSFFLTVFIQYITGELKGNTTKGAIFKEEFDTTLFDLPWKSTLNKPDQSDVSKYAKQYKGKTIKNWYSHKLSQKIPHNLAVAILQHSNTSWDIELRKSFTRWIKGFLISYSISLFTIIVIMKVDGLTIFFIAFSILSFYTHFFTLIRGHSSAVDKRETLSIHLDKIIRKHENVSTEHLRDIQDEIFYTRQESAKVPDFFFRWKQKKMNEISEDYIKSVNESMKAIIN